MVSRIFKSSGQQVTGILTFYPCDFTGISLSAVCAPFNALSKLWNSLNSSTLLKKLPRAGKKGLGGGYPILEKPKCRQRPGHTWPSKFNSCVQISGLQPAVASEQIDRLWRPHAPPCCWGKASHHASLMDIAPFPKELRSNVFQCFHIQFG